MHGGWWLGMAAAAGLTTAAAAETPLLERLLAEIQDHIQGAPQHDDTTAVVLKML